MFDRRLAMADPVNLARALKFAALSVFLALASCEHDHGYSYHDPGYYYRHGYYYGPGYDWHGSYGYGPYGFGYGPYGYGYYGDHGYRPYYWYGHEYYKHH
jgi:hypothetical protein